MFMRVAFVSSALILLSVNSAFGLSLEEGKKNGIIGETASGYLEAVEGEADEEAEKLVEDVNSKRRKAYQKIAEKHGSPIEAVEQIGGREAIDHAPPGTYVKTPAKSWRRK